MTITALFAGGDAGQVGAIELGELLGPAGSTIVGAASVWVMLNNRLRQAEDAAKAAAAAAKETGATITALAKRLDDQERAAAARLDAAERDIERWRRATRTAESSLDHIRQSLRTLLLVLRSESQGSGKVRAELLDDISGVFAVPNSRPHDDS